MRSAYDLKELLALKLLKEARHWHEQGFLSGQQWADIQTTYRSNLYHPNLVARIILFIAAFVALSGASGIFASAVFEASDIVKATLTFAAGAAVFYFTEISLIRRNHHYHSGVVEAAIYHASGYVIVAVGLLSDWNEHVLFIVSILIFLILSIRFVDLVGTGLATLTLAGFIFWESYQAGGVVQQLIPFSIIGSFTAVYFVVQRLHRSDRYSLWDGNLSLAKTLSLMLIYAGGNYLVVREGSIALLNLSLGEGEDIPFAMLFYAFTAVLPVVLLVRGVQVRNLMFLRLGILMLSMSILTFWHYYFSWILPEVLLTVAGAMVLGTTAWLFGYLKIARNGFTRDKLLSKTTLGANVAAFAVSQTLGGNVTKPDDSFKGGGGSFGGGGASGEF